MRAMRAFAPAHMLETFAAHADLMNLPIVGCDDNVCFPTQQLNVAPAVSRSDSRFIFLFEIYIMFMQSLFSTRSPTKYGTVFWRWSF